MVNNAYWLGFPIRTILTLLTEYQSYNKPWSTIGYIVLANLGQQCWFISSNNSFITKDTTNINKPTSQPIPTTRSPLRLLTSWVSTPISDLTALIARSKGNHGQCRPSSIMLRQQTNPKPLKWWGWWWLMMGDNGGQYATTMVGYANLYNGWFMGDNRG